MLQYVLTNPGGLLHFHQGENNEFCGDKNDVININKFA